MVMVKRPLVSVLMPVYNAAEFIAVSLQSIIEQDYDQLEIIIVDDGSTDQSIDVIQSFFDQRIVVVKNPENMGLAASLNKAITIATGAFLARMDADDIAHPSRISRQVNFMLDHPDVDILGTSMQYFGESRFLNHFPSTHDACKSYLMLNVCFGHPTVMFRHHIFDSPENFYNRDFRQYGEEYDLWCRLVDRFRYHNIQEVLLYYRTYPQEVKSAAESKRIKNSLEIRRNYLTSQLGEINDVDWGIHCQATFLNNISSVENIKKISEWFRRLLNINSQVSAFDHTVLKAQLAERFFEVCYVYTGIRMWTIFFFYRSEWYAVFKPSFKKTIKFVVKQLVNP